MRVFKILSTIFVLFFLITTNSCSDGFSVEFNEVIESKNRILSIRTLNAEYCPGDTAVVELHFAGQAVEPNYLCSLALDVHTAVQGGDVDGKIVSVDKYRVINPKYPDITKDDYIRFSFVIPDSALFYSESMPEYPYFMLENYILAQMPDSIKTMKKPQFINYAKNILENQDFATADEPTLFIGNVYAQMMSAKIRMIFYVNGNKFQKSITARHNKKVKNNKFVNPNRNTQTKWLKLYTVKDKDGSKGYFDPKIDSREYSYVYLYADSTTLANDKTAKIDSVITIQKGYLYYIQPDSGITHNLPNSTKDLSTSIAGYQLEERWSYEMFFQQDPQQIVDVPFSDQANVASGGDRIFEVFPPKEKTITYIDLWCVTSDKAVGERFRPIGEDIIKTKLYFKW